MAEQQTNNEGGRASSFFVFEPPLNMVLNGDDDWSEFSTLGRILALMMFLTAENSKKEKHASQKALDSLEAVDPATLPESDRTCAICFDAFESGNPELIIDDLDPDPLEDTLPSTEEPDIRFPTSSTGGVKSYTPPAPPAEAHRAVRMPCGHVFGDLCIREWLRNEVTCPLCRKEVESAPSAGGRRFMTMYSYPLVRMYIGADYSRAGESHEWSDPSLALPEVGGGGPFMGNAILPENVQEGNTSTTENTTTNNGSESNQSQSSENSRAPGSDTNQGPPNDNRGPVNRTRFRTYFAIPRFLTRSRVGRTTGPGHGGPVRSQRPPRSHPYFRAFNIGREENQENEERY